MAVGLSVCSLDLVTKVFPSFTPRSLALASLPKNLPKKPKTLRGGRNGVKPEKYPRKPRTIQTTICLFAFGDGNKKTRSLMKNMRSTKRKTTNTKKRLKKWQHLYLQLFLSKIARPGQHDNSNSILHPTPRGITNCLLLSFFYLRNNSSLMNKRLKFVNGRRYSKKPLPTLVLKCAL